MLQCVMFESKRLPILILDDQIIKLTSRTNIDLHHPSVPRTWLSCFEPVFLNASSLRTRLRSWCDEWSVYLRWESGPLGSTLNHAFSPFRCPSENRVGQRIHCIQPDRMPDIIHTLFTLIFSLNMTLCSLTKGEILVLTFNVFEGIGFPVWHSILELRKWSARRHRVEESGGTDLDHTSVVIPIVSSRFFELPRSVCQRCVCCSFADGVVVGLGEMTREWEWWLMTNKEASWMKREQKNDHPDDEWNVTGRLRRSVFRAITAKQY